MPAIDLTFDARRILVPVQLLAPNVGFVANGFAGVALLDTGATASGIKASVARHLGLSVTGKRPILTAHGEAHIERYVFRFAITPDRSRDDPPVFPFFFDEVDGSSLNDTFGFDALMGMDILAQCDLVVRRDRTVTLTFG